MAARGAGGARRRARGGGGLGLRSGHGFRNATLERAPELGPDGVRRRVRGIRLERRDDARTAVLPPQALDAGDARVHLELKGKTAT